jgi:hypothetical protein
VDLATLAVSLTRDQFRARFQCHFLCADLSVGRTTRPQRTEAFSADERAEPSQVEALPGPPFVAQLVKVQEQYPSMIMLGRTTNNDIVVGDTSISKFHAFFRLAPGMIEVADAGSRNGTFVGGTRLQPKQMARLRPGDRVRFARLAFQLLDASSCWDWLVRAMDQWG